VVFFVLLLSVTGIALNHSNEWGLDRHYVRWNWAASALGIQAPEPSSSFADYGHRVTLLGRRTYFDKTEIDYEAEALIGLVMLKPLAIVATPHSILLLSEDGKLVQRIDLTAELPVPVNRIGRLDRQPVFETAGGLFVADADVTEFEPWSEEHKPDVTWSSTIDPEPGEILILQDLYLSRSVTVEHLLLEIHSGRIFAVTAPLLLDLVAVGLIVLGFSGLGVWRSGRQRKLGHPCR